MLGLVQRHRDVEAARLRDDGRDRRSRPRGTRRPCARDSIGMMTPVVPFARAGAATLPTFSGRLTKVTGEGEQVELAFTAETIRELVARLAAAGQWPPRPDSPRNNDVIVQGGRHASSNGSARSMTAPSPRSARRCRAMTERREATSRPRRRPQTTRSRSGHPGHPHRGTHRRRTTSRMPTLPPGRYTRQRIRDLALNRAGNRALDAEAKDWLAQHPLRALHARRLAVPLRVGRGDDQRPDVRAARRFRRPAGRSRARDRRRQWHVVRWHLRDRGRARAAGRAGRRARHPARLLECQPQRHERPRLSRSRGAYRLGHAALSPPAPEPDGGGGAGRRPGLPVSQLPRAGGLLLRPRA